jgi:hypothetical protein
MTLFWLFLKQYTSIFEAYETGDFSPKRKFMKVSKQT